MSAPGGGPAAAGAERELRGDPAVRARSLWARTRIRTWPERYVLASLPLALRAEAARLLADAPAGGFAALVVEAEEVSLTLEEAAWRACALRERARSEARPFRAITLDLAVDLDVCGYLAPAAAALADAGVAIVPQCAFLRDHVLVHERDLERAVAVLEGLVRQASGT